jgi:glycosyltransferase involved in cell wall biosynthesis
VKCWARPLGADHGVSDLAGSVLVERCSTPWGTRWRANSSRLTCMRYIRVVRIHHVFPYDPEHLGLGVDQWWAGQLQRWPLAAVSRSRASDVTSVHVIGRRGRVMRANSLTLHVHGTLYSNARFHYWGDDWSVSLGRVLRRAGPEDTVVIHMESYAAARLTMRAARSARTILVLHGRGSGSRGDYSAVDRIVALHDDAEREVLDAGVSSDLVHRLVPSVNKDLFFPGADRSRRTEVVLGYVGRLEESKGAFELGDILAGLADLRPRLQCIGSPPSRADSQRVNRVFASLPVELAGELAPVDVAARMRRWDALVVPSYTEGMSLVVLEALSSHVPVVVVEGVHSESITSQRGVVTRPRGQLAEGVRHALELNRNWDTSWIPSHSEGARRWDMLYESLASWQPKEIPSWRPLVGRLRRVRLRQLP